MYVHLGKVEERPSRLDFRAERPRTRGRSKSFDDSQNPSFQRGGARSCGVCRRCNHRCAPKVVIPKMNNRKAGVVRIRIKVMAVNAAVAIGALVATTGAPWKW